MAMSRSWRAAARAWAAAGFELFTGVNVPSKAFGELVEHRSGTPHIAAAELKRRLDAGEEILIVDSRPIGEFRNMSIPGAFDCPGAELVYRVPDRLRSPDSLVVVNCAGRTRSIIGAQSLRNAGIANPVMALENGTMGWELAGLDLARGREDALPPPSPEGLAKARALADKVAERFGITRIDDAALARFEGEADRRTLYVFDVRSPEEYEAGHLAMARSAPGGQLVQATDVYMATRNARIVLVDDDGVRAVMTGSWLVQMGWPEVYVLDGGLAGRALVPGRRVPVIPELDEADVATIDAAELKRLLDAGEAAVVDLAPSITYEAGHIPGAWFAVRARLPGSLEKLPRRPVLVLTSPDAALARLAAAELGGLRLSGRVCARRRHRSVARRRVAARDRARGDGRHARRLLAPALRSLRPRGRARALSEMGDRAGPPDRARGRCRLPGAGSRGVTAAPPDERQTRFTVRIAEILALALLPRVDSGSRCIALAAWLTGAVRAADPARSCARETPIRSRSASAAMCRTRCRWRGSIARSSNACRATSCRHWTAPCSIASARRIIVFAGSGPGRHHAEQSC